MSTLLDQQSPLVLGLLKPEAYSHDCEEVELIETHISWVFLTGRKAYKVKKPLDLGFLDFSSLEKRKRYCHEELRLNSRTAPDVYEEVVPICGTPDKPLMDGKGEPFEYAVRMKQFPQDGLLDRQLQAGTLGLAKIEALAEKTAELHQEVSVSGPKDKFGTPESVAHWALENFDQLQDKIRDRSRLTRLAWLGKWTEHWLSEHRELLMSRKMDGFVRECHGDLHLGNITEIDGQVVLFDGIEFNDEIRWIDVINEMAFLFSDFQHREVQFLGWTALNRYLEITGDYAGLSLFSFYRLYRLMVRAKIDSLRLAQPGLDDQERDELESEIDIYLRQAEQTVQEQKPTLVLMRGLSGSGKSYISRGLLGQLRAIRLRSDIERKRLFQVAERASSDSELDQGIYSAEASHQTFSKLMELTSGILGAGYNTIVDATFLKTELLEQFRSIAGEMDLAVKVLDLRASEQTLRERLRKRAEAGNEASEADQKVLDSQLAGYQPLEGPGVVVVDGEDPPSAEQLAKTLLG